MPAKTLVQAWMNYIDQTRVDFNDAMTKFVAKLESDDELITLDELTTSFLKLSYNSTMGVWSAFGAVGGGGVPTITIPSGRLTGNIKMEIPGYVSEELDWTALDAVGAGGGEADSKPQIAHGELSANFVKGELSVTLQSGEWPAGSYLGAVLHGNNPIALVFTVRP